MPTPIQCECCVQNCSRFYIIVSGSTKYLPIHNTLNIIIQLYGSRPETCSKNNFITYDTQRDDKYSYSHYTVVYTHIYNMNINIMIIIYYICSLYLENGLSL